MQTHNDRNSKTQQKNRIGTVSKKNTGVGSEEEGGGRRGLKWTLRGHNPSP